MTKKISLLSLLCAFLFTGCQSIYSNSEDSSRSYSENSNKDSSKKETFSVETEVTLVKDNDEEVKEEMNKPYVSESSTVQTTWQPEDAAKEDKTNNELEKPMPTYTKKALA